MDVGRVGIEIVSGECVVRTFITNGEGTKLFVHERLRVCKAGDTIMSPKFPMDFSALVEMPDD